MANNDLDGACLCNGVQFVVSGCPETVIRCFCAHCKKNAGAPSQYCAKFEAAQVHVKKGEDLLTTYILRDTSSGYAKHKIFCKRCGCTLWTIPMRHNGQYLIVRTSLINQGLEMFPPNLTLFTTSMPPQELENSNMKFYDRMPEAVKVKNG